MNRTLARSVHLDDPPVQATLEAIASAAERGALSQLAARWTADAIRTVGDGREWRAVLEELARRVRETVTFGPDSYGAEDVQDLEETLAVRRVGDCDDFTVAMLALGRRAGLRGAAVVFLQGEDLVATHVLPAFENPDVPDDWVPVELTRETVFGAWPAMSTSGQWSIVPLQEREDAGYGVGFLPIIDSVIGLFTADKTAKANKKVAKENRAAAERQAEAIENAAAANVAVEREKIAADERTLDRVVSLAREAAPLVVGAVGLLVLTRLLGSAARS